MKETMFKKLMSLALCAVMLIGAVPFAAFAEEMQDEFIENIEEAAPFDPFAEETAAPTEAPAEEPTVHGTGFGLPDMDRDAILNRKMDKWVFPVAEMYFDSIVDFAGCRGYNEDLFYRIMYTGCIDGDHQNAEFGNDGLDIRVPAWTEVYAPVSGVLYRSSFADSKLGYAVVIEQKLNDQYSNYVVLGHVTDMAVVPSGSSVNAGDLIAYTDGTELHLTAFTDERGRAEKVANDPFWELSLIQAKGFLPGDYGTGLICVNPSEKTQTQYHNYITDFAHGPIEYTFVQPQPIPPTEAPTVAPTEAPTEAPPIAPTEAPHTEHIWDGGVTVLEPTHFSGGEVLYTCTVCGETYRAATPALPDHTFDQQNAADAYLVSAANCVSPATYVYSCICGERGTETFTVGGTADHAWDAGTVTVQPTHTTDGEMTYTCQACGQTYTEPLAPSADHVYDQQIADARYLRNAASCTEPASYYYSCICGEMGAEVFAYGEALGHTFSADWTANDTHHYHAATCEHNSEVSDFAEHTWDEGKITVPAGHMKDGETVYTCTTCGKTRTETILGDPHVYDQEVAVDKYLKAAATCLEPAVYYKTCACGEIGSETFTRGEPKGHTYDKQWSKNEQQHWLAAICEHTNEKINVSEHIWDGGKVTVQPTATSKGQRTFTCVVCGQTRTEELQPTTHEHTFATTWTGNETYHWHAATCEHTKEISGLGEHNWNGGVITAYASHTSKGEKIYTCNTCGASKREVIPEAHTFNMQVASSNYLKSYATCVSPAVYYLSCSCGAKGTETFSAGYAQGHTYATNWSTDENYHWHTCTVCGTKGDISGHYYNSNNACNTCGYTKKDSHIHTSHLGRVPAKTATCTVDGNVSYYICECGKWFTDVTATVEITDHNTVIVPAAGHVDKDNNGRCDICKERISTEVVEYTMTEGANSTWLNNSNQGMVFRCSADYSKFDHVEVDGATISSLNYTVSSGSTIVELNVNYLKRLTIGEHKIAIVSSDGRANASFSVRQGSSRSEGGRSILWVIIAGIAIFALIAAAVVAAYILYTNKPKKGGKYSRK